jgi:hypothetical protein
MEQAYVDWICAFVRFNGKRHPRDMGRPQVEAFLSWLSTERGVSASTHRRALSALLFHYQQVLGQQPLGMDAIGSPQRKPRLPVVLPAAWVAVATCSTGTSSPPSSVPCRRPESSPGHAARAPPPNCHRLLQRCQLSSSSMRRYHEALETVEHDRVTRRDREAVLPGKWVLADDPPRLHHHSGSQASRLAVPLPEARVLSGLLRLMRCPAGHESA